MAGLKTSLRRGVSLAALIALGYGGVATDGGGPPPVPDPSLDFTRFENSQYVGQVV